MNIVDRIGQKQIEAAVAERPHGEWATRYATHARVATLLPHTRPCAPRGGRTAHGVCAQRHTRAGGLVARSREQREHARAARRGAISWSRCDLERRRCDLELHRREAQRVWCRRR